MYGLSAYAAMTPESIIHRKKRKLQKATIEIRKHSKLKKWSTYDPLRTKNWLLKNSVEALKDLRPGKKRKKNPVIYLFSF